MAKRGMAMGATTKANIGAGRKSGLRLSSGGLGTSPFSQAKSAASKSVRKVNSEVKSKIAKAKKKGIAGKPTSKRGNLLNSSPSSSSDIGIDSFRASKAKAMLEGTMRAKKRMERRIGFTGLPNTINFSERDSEWRKNLSLSLKRYWARKRPGRIEGNIGELNQAKKRYDAGESATSILLDPNLSGKTKTEIVGKKVGELRGKFDVIVDHIKDRGKDFKRGFRGSRRDIRGRNIAEKYNLDVVVPAVGAVGLGANTALALKGTGVKTALMTGEPKDLIKIATTGIGVKKLPIGTRAAAVGALGLGAYSLATQIQRHRKPQVFKYAKLNSGNLEFAEAEVKSHIRRGKGGPVRVKGYKKELSMDQYLKASKKASEADTLATLGLYTGIGTYTLNKIKPGLLNKSELALSKRVKDLQVKKFNYTESLIDAKANLDKSSKAFKSPEVKLKAEKAGFGKELEEVYYRDRLTAKQAKQKLGVVENKLRLDKGLLKTNRFLQKNATRLGYLSAVGMTGLGLYKLKQAIDIVNE